MHPSAFVDKAIVVNAICRRHNSHCYVSRRTKRSTGEVCGESVHVGAVAASTDDRVEQWASVSRANSHRMTEDRAHPLKPIRKHSEVLEHVCWRGVVDTASERDFAIGEFVKSEIF